MLSAKCDQLKKLGIKLDKRVMIIVIAAIIFIIIIIVIIIIIISLFLVNRSAVICNQQHYNIKYNIK